MTETKLSEQLGLTKAAVGYHLHLLLDAGLIKIDKVEAEKHGILQKFYASIALVFIIDPAYIPEDVKRYFIRREIEHLKGMFSVFKLHHHLHEISSKTLEKLAEAMLKQLRIVGQKHTKEVVVEDAASIGVKIYAEALANLTKQKEWRSLFTQTK